MVARDRWLSVADPIHGIIQFDKHDETHQLLLAVMNSWAFQRLRRIYQMGLAEMVFPNATHTRFVHSLGAAHLMGEAIKHLERERAFKAFLNQDYPGTTIPMRTLLMLGILIHDIGHAPLSHTLEDILNLKDLGLSHDEYWNRKILTEDNGLNAIWDRFGRDLPDAVCRFMGADCHGKPGEKHFLASLISSQLDMDRLDYLLRDSHFLGVKYGYIESQRIIDTLQIAPHGPGGIPCVAVRAEAIPAVEHYLFGRHEAYKMALHPLDKASEISLKMTLLRFQWARQQGIETGDAAEGLFQLMTDPHSVSTQQYLMLDDHTIWEAVKHWSVYARDPVLHELAGRLMRHQLFKYVNLRAYGLPGELRDIPKVYEALQQHYAERRLSFEYGFDEITVKARPLYRHDKEPIWISTAEGTVVDLKDLSSLPLHAEGNRGEKHLVFVWDGIAREFLRKTLRKHVGLKRER